MPGDISKHTKYIVNEPYPEPKVKSPNVYYANILLKDYAGGISELTAINLYIYQHMVSEGEHKDYAELIGGVSMAEMKHLELLGETIKLLGVKPIYMDNACPPGRIWTPCFVNFTTYIKDMLIEDIKSEQKAIDNYKYHITLIDDIYIKKLLERIIVDEELHLKLFKKLYDKYFSR
ncbi:manganese containing catalase [Clostridium homopropionicum DSM 5847]|uniref:Manganese containing catalase n=1 Tax=Clostridium homopropionicum DSM 5847 TaxID=1121318 RepID=A0A0L6ZER2_9CLOT|nr:ferritin-like domain-containing protein [Clostridium homopropionicum]KOA21442.1 manganese containing catalase [Clostridium homopropionicum DSM 5847]SFG09710.1 bacterioferritin [Clostridium homopropionicum]